ncbi:MAG: hypothetical protein ARM1_0587 [Candidatus Micrarchaeota archaeon]|nr:MAG: hypothetical protein ARM1_0587 [Candidatus Micrarchaeota archaeon]
MNNQLSNQSSSIQSKSFESGAIAVLLILIALVLIVAALIAYRLYTSKGSQGSKSIINIKGSSIKIKGSSNPNSSSSSSLNRSEINSSSSIVSIPSNQYKIESNNSSIYYYANITLFNNQSISTSNTFQQEIIINSSSPLWSYISKNRFAQNVIFFYPNNKTIIPSWLQSFNSSAAVFWIKVKGIEADSYENVSIGFGNYTESFFNNISTGEAPELSSIYAEYDDGNNVFNFYDNFVDQQLNRWKFDAPEARIIADNSLSFFSNYGFNFIFTIEPFNNSVIHVLVINYSNKGPNKPYIGWFDTQTSKVKFQSSIVSIGYYSLANPTNNRYSALIDSGNMNPSSEFTVQYIFITAYPPDGVMPSYRFSSIHKL